MKPVPDRWGSMPSDIDDNAYCSSCGKPVSGPFDEECGENEEFLCARCDRDRWEEERS